MKEIEIVKLDYFGRGIGYIDGKITFISHALPKELVRVGLVKEKKKYQLGKVDQIVVKSPLREKSICPYFDDSCGGCQLRHMNKVGQKEFKINRVGELLLKNGKMKIDGLTLFEGDDNHYRNKVVFQIKDKEFGFYEEESFNFIPIDYCYLLDKQINDLLPLLRSILLKPHQLTKVMIRCGVNTKESMIVFYGKVNHQDVIHTFSNQVTTGIVNDDVLWGKGVIFEEVLNKRFTLSKDAFFQVNTKQVEALYQDVLSNLVGKEINTLLDLYSGTGTIGILASDKVRKVIGVEVVESAVLNAKENAKLNGVDNIEFFHGKVEDILFSKTFPQVDAVIVDPPRSGLDKKTREMLLKFRSSLLIYISCDVATLSRDLIDFLPLYQLEKITLVDMFPNTYHVECVCVLNRR